MKFKTIIMVLALIMPVFTLPMEPEKPRVGELIELAQRKEGREAESDRFRLKSRKKLEMNARQAAILNYWLSIKKAILTGGLTELLKQAKSEGLDISATRKDPNGNTILHYAAELNTPDIIEKFVVNGVGPDPVNNEGMTPLMIAAQQGNVAAASALLKKQAQVNVGTKRSGTYPLLEAVDAKHWDIVQLLLEHGAKVEFKGPAESSILGYLQELEDVDGLKKLITILHSLPPTEQRSQLIQQIASIAADITNKKEGLAEHSPFELPSGVVERPKSLKEEAEEAAREAIESSKKQTWWEYLFGK